MTTISLTKRAVERLRAPDPSGKQTLYWAEDGDHRGLGILVSGVADSKTWVAQGKVAGRTRRVSLGPVRVMSIEEAWEAAKAKLAEMYRGEDPKRAARRRARAAMTVADVLDDYLAASPNLTPKTVKIYRATARHLAPFLGRPLAEVSADEVEDHFHAVADAVRERRERGEIRGGVNVDGRATANGALRLLRALWNHQAERDPDLPRNPVGRRFRRQWHRLDRRTRHVPPERLAEFHAATRRLPSEIQRDLVLFALYTGAREREAAGLRWSEVDLPGRTIRLPAGRMKSHREFSLPMSDLVHRLLVARRAYGRDGDFVFPGHGRSGHCEAFTYALRQIAAATGIVVSPHDLRRTFASVAETAEISPMALKLMIAHSAGNDVTLGYVQLPQAELRRAAQRVADRLKALCSIEEPEGVARLG